MYTVYTHHRRWIYKVIAVVFDEVESPVEETCSYVENVSSLVSYKQTHELLGQVTLLGLPEDNWFKVLSQS